MAFFCFTKFSENFQTFPGHSFDKLSSPGSKFLNMTQFQANLSHLWASPGGSNFKNFPSSPPQKKKKNNPNNWPLTHATYPHLLNRETKQTLPSNIQCLTFQPTPQRKFNYYLHNQKKKDLYFGVISHHCPLIRPEMATFVSDGMYF